MKSIGTTIAGLVACTMGAYLMASALFGHSWLVGEHQGLEVHGGIIDAHFCSKADDPDPMPIGIGDLEGCDSRMYARSELGSEAGAWFGGTTHMTLFFGAASVTLFLVLSAIYALALRIEIVPRSQRLGYLELFDLEDGAIELHAHPGSFAGRSGLMALVFLCMALAAAPESLAAGSDVARFAAGCLLAIAGGTALDPRTLPAPMGNRLSSAEDASSGAAPAAQRLVENAAGDELEATLEAELEESDTPSCVRCGGTTEWFEKQGRHRCQKCGLYQPLHPPGALADA